MKKAIQLEKERASNFDLATTKMLTLLSLKADGKLQILT